MKGEKLYEELVKVCADKICEILGEDEIDYDTNFFYLGLESVAMTKIVADLEEMYYVNIAYEDFIEHATIYEFAEYLQKLIEDGTSNGDFYLKDINFEPNREKRYEPFALSDLQEAYYVGRFQEEEYNGIPTNGYMEMTCDEYDHERFQNTILKLINRHDMLRCYFDDEGMQHVIPEIDFYDIEIVDLRTCKQEEIEEKILEVRKEMVNLRVDIESAPLFITKVSMLSGDKAVIHFYVDALIMDGWSYEIFHRELEELYEDETVRLRELGVGFRDYLEFKKEFKKSKKYMQDKEFWLERIDELPEPALLPELMPLEHIKDKIGGQVECELDIHTWEKIEEAARNHAVTPFSVLFSSFIAVVSRWNYKQRLLFNIPEFDRPMFHSDMDKILGVCSAFLLFPSDISKKITFKEMVKQTHEKLTTLIQHHGFSGIEISREMYKRSGEHNKALAPLVFGMLPDLPHTDKNILKVRYQENHTSQVWIDINTCIYDECIQFNWNYIKGHLDAEMLKNMVQIQKEILMRVANEDAIWEECLSFELPESDKSTIEKSNQTEQEVSFVLLNQVIEECLETYKDNVYVETDNAQYTYQEVADIVSSMADDFLKMGCQKGDRIILYMPKGIRQVCAVLATVRIGCVYVPIDYTFSQKMLQKCARNVEAKVIVMSHEKQREISIKNCAVYVPNMEQVRKNVILPSVSVEGDDLVAIIHTSGSTGMPKAVMVTHKGLYNSLQFTNEKFHVQEDDRCIALTNLAHDMEMYDIFGMLMAGASMFMPLQENSTDPEYWINKLKQQKVTIWNSVPAFIEMLLEAMTEEDKEALLNFRLMIFGGDYLHAQTVQKIWNFNEKIQVVNVGGPTETTLWNIYHIVTKEDVESGVLPYGKPISNTKYYLLNERMEEVPVGVVGMMYCAGVGITKGYWGNEEQTKKKYVQYKKTGEIIYQTGDLGKYNENGEIIFCGREDRQIKINGKRIELNGIKSVILENFPVSDSVVKYFEDAKILVAYYVAEREIDTQKFQNQLIEDLPKYMIPEYFVKVDKIPITKNGKVNYAELPDYRELVKVIKESDMEPVTELEKKVITICNEFIEGKIYLNSDFFMIGGDSLLAIRLLARLREEFEVPIALRELYGKNKICDWCRLIEGKLTEDAQSTKLKEDSEQIGNKWIAHGIVHERGNVNLICFPHAGSSAMFYSEWSDYFDETFNILPVQYPGRENRQEEAMYNSIIEMAKDFVEENEDLFEQDFAIFGHCTGSIVAYEVLKLVEEKYNKTSVAFFASSNVAPNHSILVSTKDVSDEEFVKGLGQYGFIDSGLFALEEFSSYFLPIIRHDFDMQENYVCENLMKLNTPIFSLSGKEDASLAEYGKVLDWKKFTNKEFEDKVFEGGHFYMEEHMEEVSHYISENIKRCSEEKLV